MAKLKNPLLSLRAVGRLAKHLSLTRRRRQNIIETTPVIKDAKTLAQLSWRHMYQKAVALWLALSGPEKQEWESLARPKHMTGFAWFMSQALKPNPGLYLPLQGGTMQGNIDMAKFRILKLPLPTLNQEAASKKYHDDNLPPGGYTEGARVYNSPAQSIPNATATVLAFNGEKYDTDTIHDNVTNNSRLTCKTAGKYLIFLNAAFESNNVGYRWYEARVNGVTIIAFSIQNAVNGLGSTFPVVTTYGLSVNDYVEALVKQNSGGALDIIPVVEYSPIFGMGRIG